VLYPAEKQGRQIRHFVIATVDPAAALSVLNNLFTKQYHEEQQKVLGFLFPFPLAHDKFNFSGLKTCNSKAPIILAESWFWK